MTTIGVAISLALGFAAVNGISLFFGRKYEFDVFLDGEHIVTKAFDSPEAAFEYARASFLPDRITVDYRTGRIYAESI